MRMALFLLMAGWAMCGAAVEPGSIALDGAWKFRPDPRQSGGDAGWAAPDFPDGDWALVEAGARWEDAGFPEVDCHGWYRRTVEIPESWRDKPVFLFAAAVNDACVVYCNGRRVGAFGSEPDHSAAETPILANLSGAVRPGAANVIAIDVTDWSGSGGLWRMPVQLCADLNKAPMDHFVSVQVEPGDGAAHRAWVHLNGFGLGLDDSHTAAVTARADHDGTEAHAKQRLAGAPPAASFELPLPEHRAPEDSRLDCAHMLRVTVTQQDSAQPCFEWTRRIECGAVPAWPAPHAGLQVRNNFVTELLTCDMRDGTRGFPNPRDGWVHVTCSGGGENTQVFLDQEREPLVWRSVPETRTLEAMRLLKAGEHAVRIENAAGGTLELRTVPELTYCYYPATPHIAPFGPYDWDYVSRHVLPHVNTIVSSGQVAKEEFTQWQREGRQWIGNSSLPGLAAKTAPGADEVFAAWAGVPGASQAGFSGIMVDEFLSASPAHYQAWTAGLRRLCAHPEFAGRTFYAWCGDIFGYPPARAFCAAIPELGGLFSWEKYLAEAASEAEARARIARDLCAPMRAWRQVQPGIERNIVMCLGYLCSVPESLNRDPAVDYHVFMDLQFQALATEPAFWNLHGVMEYSASYADEESLRWAHQLFRHYCIEGKRTRLTDTPYRPGHLVNPDFAGGLDGWTVEPAAPGGIEAGSMEGYSHMQGRYPRTTQGDRFCIMKRAAQGVNRVRQTVRNLIPGRMYSLKVISADLGQLDKAQAVSLGIQMEGAECVDALGFEYAYPINYAHEFGPYTREHPAYFTLRRVVFRAAGETVELSISDAGGDGRAPGPEDQEIAFNFVEVQPFR